MRLWEPEVVPPAGYNVSEDDATFRGSAVDVFRGGFWRPVPQLGGADAGARAAEAVGGMAVMCGAGAASGGVHRCTNWPALPSSACTPLARAHPPSWPPPGPCSRAVPRRGVHRRGRRFLAEHFLCSGLPGRRPAAVRPPPALQRHGGAAGRLRRPAAAAALGERLERRRARPWRLLLGAAAAAALRQRHRRAQRGWPAGACCCCCRCCRCCCCCCSAEDSWLARRALLACRPADPAPAMSPSLHAAAADGKVRLGDPPAQGPCVQGIAHVSAGGFWGLVCVSSAAVPAGANDPAALNVGKARPRARGRMGQQAAVVGRGRASAGCSCQPEGRLLARCGRPTSPVHLLASRALLQTRACRRSYPPTV